MMACVSKGYCRLILCAVPCVIAVLVQFVDNLVIRLFVLCLFLPLCIVSTVYEIRVLRNLKDEQNYLKKQLAATENMVITDGLTGLYNYRYLRQYLEDDFLSALGEDFILSIIMMDVDCFKAYNDKYGHLEGDKLLRQLALIFKSSIRENDIAVRYGGEEFVIILPGLDASRAYQIAERIRARIESTEVLADSDLEDQVTVSCGIATYPIHAKTSDELLNMADKALYRAKKLSKNTVCIYSDELFS